MIPRSCLLALVGGAVLLPVAITLVLATGFVFAGMQDPGAARVLNGIALALGLLWVLDLVAMVMLLGFEAARRAEIESERDLEEEP